MWDESLGELDHLESKYGYALLGLDYKTAINEAQIMVEQTCRQKCLPPLSDQAMDQRIEEDLTQHYTTEGNGCRTSLGMDTLDYPALHRLKSTDKDEPIQNDIYYFTTETTSTVTSNDTSRLKTQDIDKIPQILQLKEPETSVMTISENKGWDIFRLLPPKPDRVGHGFWHDASLQILKLCTFIVLFILTLSSAVVAKSSFLLMTSAIGWGGQNMTICRDKIPGILIFQVFPDLDAVTASQLTNAMCFVPAILSLLSRRPNRVAFFFVIIDIVAIAAQSSGFWAYPVTVYN
uniref:MFS domain-containing protein n=1 Tax=Heterorhabditis bacteriophora TaxID=37862 RepID=A0A1I7XDG2_HETBA